MSHCGLNLTEEDCSKKEKKSDDFLLSQVLNEISDEEIEFSHNSFMNEESSDNPFARRNSQEFLFRGINNEESKLSSHTSSMSFDSTKQEETIQPI